MAHACNIYNQYRYLQCVQPFYVTFLDLGRPYPGNQFGQALVRLFLGDLSMVDYN